MFSGFGMVLTLMIPLRKWFGMEHIISVKHLENMAKIILLTGSLVGYAYAMEFFIAWYSGNPYEAFVFVNRAFGDYAWAYWIMVSCNVITPQFIWFKKIRRSATALFILSIFVSIGMWFERFVIVATSLHHDFLPSSWDYFSPTIWDWGTLVGSFGLFFTLFLLFVRYLPMIAMSELKAVMPHADPHFEGYGSGHGHAANAGEPAAVEAAPAEAPAEAKEAPAEAKEDAKPEPAASPSEPAPADTKEDAQEEAQAPASDPAASAPGASGTAAKVEAPEVPAPGASGTAPKVEAPKVEAPQVPAPSASGAAPKVDLSAPKPAEPAAPAPTGGGGGAKPSTRGWTAFMDASEMGIEAPKAPVVAPPKVGTPPKVTPPEVGKDQDSSEEDKGDA